MLPDSLTCQKDLLPPNLNALRQNESLPETLKASIQNEMLPNSLNTPSLNKLTADSLNIKMATNSKKKTKKQSIQLGENIKYAAKRVEQA